MELNNLVRAAQEGDTEARGFLAAWANGELLSFFSSRFGFDAAADLTQTTLTAIMGKLDNFDASDPTPFRSWVFGFALNQARTQAREPCREAARRALLELQVIVPMMSPTSELYSRELDKIVARCIGQLPEIYQQVLLHDLDSGDDRVLAERLGILVATVYSRRVRARDLLRPLLEVALSTPHRRSTPSSE